MGLFSKIRTWKNRTFLDWQWDLLIGGACVISAYIIGFVLSLFDIYIVLDNIGKTSLIFALITNLLSWYLNRIFELKDFLLRLIIPLIFLAV